MAKELETITKQEVYNILNSERKRIIKEKPENHEWLPYVCLLNDIKRSVEVGSYEKMWEENKR